MPSNIAKFSIAAGLTLFLGFVISFIEQPAPPSPTSYASTFGKMQEGKPFTLPPIARAYGCKSWSTVERIEAAYASADPYEGQSAVLSGVTSGECVAVAPGDTVLVSRVSARGFQFRAPSGPGTYWAPVTYEKIGSRG